MKKIPTLYDRDWNGDRSRVTRTVNPEAAWVLTEPSRATRKRDGTCCLVRDGRLWKRYDVKKGKPTPDGFVPAQDPDPATGHHPGWLPVGEGPEDRWHREAFFARWSASTSVAFWAEVQGRTFELCGPKVQSNPEGLAEHQLIEHGVEELADAPRDFDGLAAYLAEHAIEGIV